MGASLTSLLLWFHSLSLILLLQASLSHLSSSCVTLSSSAEFKCVCASASGRETFELHLSVHVPECMYVRVRGRNEVCLTCACRRPQDPQPQLTGLWMLDGGFYDLVKTGYIIQSSIHSEREKAKRERWIGRKRERERERGCRLSEILMNSLTVGGKNDCESWQRRTRFQLRWFLLCHQLFYFLPHLMGDVRRKTEESEKGRCQGYHFHPDVWHCCLMLLFSPC